MYSHTRKVGSVGRYGARIGRKTREEMRKVEDLKKTGNCPRCGKTKLARKSSGIWMCRSCSLVFTGGAYIAVAEKPAVEVEE